MVHKAIFRPVYQVIKSIQRQGFSSDIFARIAYITAECLIFIWAYGHLEDLLDVAYDAQSTAWKISKLELLRLLDNLNETSDAQEALLSPLNRVLRQKIDALRIFVW